MRNAFPVRVLQALSILCAAPLFAERGVDVDAALGTGEVSYVETVALEPVRSDWDASTVHLRVRGALTRWTVHPYGSFMLLGSETATEIWRRDRELVQRNDLTLLQANVRGGLRIPVATSLPIRFQPRVGVLYSSRAYIRENFQFISPNGVPGGTSDGEITEDVRAAGPSVGATLGIRLGEKWTLDLDSEYTRLIFQEADNDGFDVEIEGEGGWSWSHRAALAVDLVDATRRMGLAVTVDIQEIEGGRVRTSSGGRVEWPDNRQERFGVELFWSGSF